MGFVSIPGKQEPSPAIKSLYHFGDEKVPVLALAIHNGHFLTEYLSQNCGISPVERLREEDPYTGQIAERCSNYVTVYSSRFMVDLNRSPAQAVYQNPEDCWGLNARLTPLDSSYLAKLHKAYDEWYQILDYHVQALLEKHAKLLIFDIHSYNHRRGGKDARPDPQILNPDLIVGRSNMPSHFYPLVAELTKRLNGSLLDGYPLDCREDIKFSGGNLSRYLHSKYPDRVISLSIEFKKIFMDEYSGEVDHEKFGRLIALFWDRVSDWTDKILKIALPVR